MCLASAKAEITNPPIFEWSPVLIESAIMLAVAAALVNIFA